MRVHQDIETEELETVITMWYKHFKSIVQDGLSRNDCLNNYVLYLLEYLILIDA